MIEPLKYLITKLLLAIAMVFGVPAQALELSILNDECRIVAIKASEAKFEAAASYPVNSVNPVLNFAAVSFDAPSSYTYNYDAAVHAQKTKGAIL